jgi:hypothetical protein
VTRTIWALYLCTAAHSVAGISLHTTRRACLETAIDYFAVGDDDNDEIPDEATRAAADDDDLADIVGALADAGNVDWHIDECVLPPEAPAQP